MKKNLRLFMMTLLCAVVNVMSAQTVTLDFTSNTWGLPEGSGNKATESAQFNNGSYTISLQAADGYYFNTDGYLMLGKSGSTLTLPAFNFKVGKIAITGTSGASAAVKQNIFVGNQAVSNETTGAKNVTNEYDILSDYQSEGTIYVLKVTSAHNTQISKIEIYEAIATTVPTPTFDPEGGTFYVDSEEPFKNVEISCENDDATIYYTIDGSTPNENSDVYNGPISISTTTTIKAIAIDNGEKSNVATATFTIKEITSSFENLADLSSQTVAATYLVDPLDAVVTYVKGNNAYIEDESGAILLYMNGHGLTAGQTINGPAVVDFQLRNGNPQITNIDLTDCKVEDGTAPEPTTVAASAWSTSIATVLSQYFKVTGATITQEGTLYYVQLGSEKVQLYGQGDARDFSVTPNKSYTIIGFPTLYNTTKELVIYELPVAEASEKEEAGLSYGEDVTTVTVTIGGTYTLPTLSNPNNLTVTYTSSDTNVATIDATGNVTVLAKGQTTIKAAFAGNDNYLAGEASYTLVVKEQLPEGTFFYETFDNLAGTGGRDGEFTGTVGNGGFNNANGTNTTDETWTSTTNSGAAFKCAKIGSSSDASALTTGAINMTGDGSLTFEAAGWGSGSNKLTVSASGAKLDGGTDITLTLTNGAWKSYTVAISDAAGEVILTFAGKRGFIDEIKVTNEKVTVLLNPELSFDKTEVTATYGEPFTAPTLTKPEGVTVTYTSSNEKVATVDANTGEVTLKGAEGTVTITATSEEDDTYQAGSASYTITVTVPVIDNDDVFKLVSTDDLAEGDEIIIVNVNVETTPANEEEGTEASTTYTYTGMGKQNKNNRAAVEMKYYPDGTLKGNNKLQVITLEKSTTSTFWWLNVGDGYLYAAGGKSDNYLKTEIEPDSKADADISISDEDEIASIIFQDEATTRNTLKYNSSNKLFSCYASGQDDVKIYRKLALSPGDVNGDGSVNVTDVMLVVRYAVNGVISPNMIFKNADFNNDGQVNVTDAMAILRESLKN